MASRIVGWSDGRSRPTIDDLARRNRTPPARSSAAVVATLKVTTACALFFGFLTGLIAACNVSMVLGVVVGTLFALGAVFMVTSGLLLLVLGSNTEWFSRMTRGQNRVAWVGLAIAVVGAAPAVFIVACLVLAILLDVLIALLVLGFLAFVVFACLAG